MRPSRLEAVEARRRNLRTIFIGIIVVTLPFYCAGVLLWGTAPRNQPQTTTVTPTTPPPSATVPGQPTITSFPITVVVPTQGGFPTVNVPPPTAFVPSVIPATRFITATPTISIPTATTPPPNPTFAAPPTSALPTDYVPLPFDTPLPP